MFAGMQRLVEERKGLWAIALTKPVPVAFENPSSDWLEDLSWPIRNGEFRASGNDFVGEYREAFSLYS